MPPMTPLDPEGFARVFAPSMLAATLSHHEPEAARPRPLVFVGTSDAWRRLADGQDELATRLHQSPVATAALVTGGRPAALERLLDAFDLVAVGTEDHVVTAARSWLVPIARNPQASSVLAALTRQGAQSLGVESLAYSMLQAGPEHAAWLRTFDRVPSGDPGPRVCLTNKRQMAVLTLTRPRRHNALDSLMREDLCDALDALAQTPERQVLLRGNGASFCSGGDLAEFGTLADPTTAHFVRTGRSVAARLDRIADRTTCLLHGHCVGAGVELAAFCHRVVATRSTTLWLPEVGFGLLPGSGGTVSIPRRIGRQQFIDLAVTGRRVDASTALELGLVDGIIDDPVSPDIEQIP